MPAMPPKMKLLAMSGFFYDWSFFQLTTGMEEPSSDLNALVAAAESFCNKDAQGQAAYNNSLARPESAPYCYTYCFGAAYAHALLHTGYGMEESNTPIQVVQTISGNDLGWAYGAMLWEVNRLGWSYNGSNASNDSNVAFYVSLGVCGVLLLTTVALAVAFVRLKKQQEEESLFGYNDLNGGESL